MRLIELLKQFDGRPDNAGDFGFPEIEEPQ